MIKLILFATYKLATYAYILPTVKLIMVFFKVNIVANQVYLLEYNFYGSFLNKKGFLNGRWAAPMASL